MTIVPFNPRRLSVDDVRTLRPTILDLIDRGRASWWNLDMSLDGYDVVTILGPRRRPLFAITKERGRYRVVGDHGRPLLESSSLDNVIAVLA